MTRRRRSRAAKRQSPPPDHDWSQPYPPLRSEDRLSHYGGYADLLPEYDLLVAEVGKAEVDERMDYFFFFLGKSARLSAEPEFADVDLGLDPFDFAVYAALDFCTRVADIGGEAIAPEGVYDESYQHILSHTMRRCLTPRLRTDLKRRARRVTHRCRDTGIGSMANAVEVALDDEDLPPAIIGLLQYLFSDALLERVLELPDHTTRMWEERDRSLDRWMEQIAAASDDRPAERAIEKLARAGSRALPHVLHLYYEEELEYGDYPLLAALEIAARVPCQLSLHLLADTLVNSSGLEVAWVADLLADLPDLAGPWLACALTVPGGPDWDTALWGYSILGRTGHPDAFDVLVDGLCYQGETPHETESIQSSASEGLLALRDERAIAVLHDYLRDPRAELGARGDLLLGLLEDEHPWAGQIAGDLSSPEELPQE